MILIVMVASLALVQNIIACDQNYIKTFCTTEFEPLDARLNYPEKCSEIIYIFRNDSANTCSGFDAGSMTLDEACQAAMKSEIDFDTSYAKEECESNIQRIRSDLYLASCGKTQIDENCSEELESLNFVQDLVEKNKEKYPCANDLIVAHEKDLKVCEEYKVDQDFEKACRGVNELITISKTIKAGDRVCHTQFVDMMRQKWAAIQAENGKN